MRRLAKHQVFIYSLVGFLVWAQLYGLSLSLTNLNKPFDFASSKELLPYDNGSLLALTPLWQPSGSNPKFDKSTREINSNRLLTRMAIDAQIALCCCQHQAIPNHHKASFHVNNTVFKFTDFPVFHYLDLPPPLLSLL